MRLIEAFSKIQRLGVPFLTTKDAAALFNVPPGHASKILERLRNDNLITSLGKGKWLLPGHVHTFSIPEFLTSPLPAYISLQTALHYHGLIEQIPTVIYSVSPARTHNYTTPVGTFSIHHITLDFFFGFEEAGPNGAKIATPEKALLDILYLAPTRTRLFRSLPEVEFPKHFNKRLALSWANKIPSVRRRNMVVRLFEEVWKESRRQKKA